MIVYDIAIIEKTIHFYKKTIVAPLQVEDSLQRSYTVFLIKMNSFLNYLYFWNILVEWLQRYKAKKKRIVSRAIFFFKNRCGRAAFYFNFYSAENRCGNFFIEEIPEMESRLIKLANITGNGPQRRSETTWSLPIMMLRNWKSIFFSFYFLESNKKK